MNLSKQIWLLLFIACIVYSLWMYNQLPQNIIIGWRIDGTPKDWSEKTTFFIWFTITGGMLNLLFYILSSSSLRKIPESLLNLPWKYYWFATTERKEIAYLKLQLIISNTGILINSIMLLILNSILQANTELSILQIPERTIVWIILGSLALFTGSMFYIMKPTGNET